MKPAPFEYHAPERVADAVGLLSELGDDAKLLAGGQSLVPMLALRLTRFPHLVDLNRVPELRFVDRVDGEVSIGAMTLQATVGEDPVVAADVPLLAESTRHIGHFQIRNRGTIGGSLAHADPAAEYPAVALALDARFEVASDAGTRFVDAAQFFDSMWTTRLEANDVLVSVRFPVWEGRCGFAFEEVARRLGDFALAGVACGVELDERGGISRAAVAMLGMGSTPVRATAAEEALAGATADGADLAAVGRAAVAGLDPPDDVHASRRYRLSVGAHLVERAVGRAIQQAKGEQ